MPSELLTGIVDEVGETHYGGRKSGLCVCGLSGFSSAYLYALWYEQEVALKTFAKRATTDVPAAKPDCGTSILSDSAPSIAEIHTFEKQHDGSQD